MNVKEKKMKVKLEIVIEMNDDPDFSIDPLTSAVSNLEYDGFKIVSAEETEVKETQHG
jgi:hypothetical protein